MEVVAYQPYFDPEFESLIERMYPPRVCIDNETYPDCTLVKVDSANKQGILLEMVQVLTDLDLVISKSYISSDGGWFMDVFHVMDQLGNKLTDESLLLYIQQALCASRRGGISKDIQRRLKRAARPRHVSTEHTALEITVTNRPGVMSEISAVLFELGYQVTAAAVWTHNNRAALIVYIEDGSQGGPITDPKQLTHIQEQLEIVVVAHHEQGERMSVKLTTPTACQTHTERRLHQLMSADRDYEDCRGCEGSCGEWQGCTETHVSIENYKDRGYSVVNVRSRDRPKLLFDTVCALTDMQYVVCHAAVSSKGIMADQEYFIRQKNGHILDTESEKQKLTRCLVGAIERRISHGLRLDICTRDRMGLLSDVTRMFRENGLSITRAEIGTSGDSAIASFYVTDISGQNVSQSTLDAIRKEIGESVLVVHRSPGGMDSQASSSSATISRTTIEDDSHHRQRFSLGSLLWSQLEWLSSNFGNHNTVMRSS